MKHTMYHVPYRNTEDALKLLYRFMTIPFLNRPECSALGATQYLFTVMNTGDGFLSEEEFYEKVKSSPYKGITCTASTDAADLRRVVLAYLPGQNMMVLSFPAANGKLNAQEEKIFDYLRD